MPTRRTSATIFPASGGGEPGRKLGNTRRTGATGRRLRPCKAAALLLASGLALAQPPLTPTGAERDASADGRIPAWQGGLSSPPAGWQASEGYVDPYAGEQPLYVVDRDSLASHADELAPGLAALVATRRQFRLPVYQTHRSFAWPPEVMAASEANEGKARVEDKRLVGHRAPGIPFRRPASGLEAIYNHLQGWIGGVSSCSDWFPIRDSGSYYRVGWCSTVVQAANMDALAADGDAIYFLGWYDAPAALIGTVYLVHEPLDLAGQERRAWIYNAGQRRVRRAPDLAFDNIADGTEGMAMIDDGAGFNGSPARYDWTLVGKRALLVPYNAYRLGDPALRYASIIAGNDVDPALMRYELHRVWVVEATLAQGMSHAYGRRTFYLDEDSWQVLMVENRDSRGELWRVILRPMIQLYDVPTMVARAQLEYDLRDGSLLLSGLDNERPQPAMRWHVKGRLSDFQPQALRRR